MFWENYVKLCNSVNKAPNVVAAEVGIKGSGTVTGWKRGAVPRDSVLLKLADYFGCTTSELLSETSSNPQKETATQTGSGLVEEFGRIFDSLTPENQTAIIAEMLKRKREQ